MAMVSCLRLLRQEMRRPCSLAWAKAGRSKPARMAMIPMTTSSSMSVKAPSMRRHVVPEFIATTFLDFEFDPIAGDGPVNDAFRLFRCLKKGGASVLPVGFAPTLRGV